MDYASKGVAGTGLGLGIAGTALGVLDMIGAGAGLLRRPQSDGDKPVTAEEAYKPILKAIAKEEWSHAERLKEILYDMDGTLNQCELAARDEAKNSIEGSK